MARKVASFDAWRTEKPGYRVDEFYCRSKDRQGHSTVFHVKLPDDIAGEIPAIVQSGKIPAYRTIQDFIRDAIIHRLHWITEHVDDLPSMESLRSMISRQVLDNATARYQRELTEYKTLASDIEVVCEAALASDDLEELGHYLEAQTEAAERLREPFKSRLLTVIDRYGDRLRSRLEE